MESQPFNLVNSFPNSTGLEDRRARFIDAMRDPFSTKSPYSIFDNGSNTFAREGNTVGAEVPVQPVINQADYFQQPRTLIRQPQRVPVSSFGNFSGASPINRFDDGLDDEASQASSNYQNSWNRQQQIQEENASPSFGIGPGFEEEYDEEAPEYKYDKVITSAKETRFSNKPPMPPLYNKPYKNISGEMQMREDPIEVDESQYEKQRDGPPLETRFSNNPPMPPVNIPIQKYSQGEAQMIEEPFDDDEALALVAKKEKEELGQTEQELLDAQAELDEIAFKKGQQQAAYEKLAEELGKQKAILKKYVNVRDKLADLIATGKSKVAKGSDLKTEIKQLLNDPSFTEYSGDKNLRGLADAEKIYNFIKKGSETIEKRIERLAKDKQESPIKRIAPAGTAKISTLSSFPRSTSGGKQAGGGAASISNML